MLKKSEAAVLLVICLAMPFIVNAQDTDKIDLANEYYQQEEYDKAAELYQELDDNPKNVPLIHDNYFNLLLNRSAFKQVKKYMASVLEAYPDNIRYRVDQLYVYHRMEDVDKLEDTFNDWTEALPQHSYNLVANYLMDYQMSDYALKLFLNERERMNDDRLFAIEVANIYRRQQKKEAYIEEYLKYVADHPSRMESIQNILQNALDKKEDLDMLEEILITKVQKNPDERHLSEMLIWTKLQKRNFYGAFIQARSYDKRFNREGQKLYEVGEITLENRDYSTAIKIFQYIVDNYGKSNIYGMARNQLIKSREELVKNTFPVDTTEISHLISDYTQLIEQVPVTKVISDAKQSMARLYAFYLGEFDSAKQLLNELIEMPRIAHDMRMESKLVLGDIYLLTREPWEATLLYSQVEKAAKETSLGYEAKLRNAKLSYYKGEFSLAKNHLDVLKMATTREIANNAMDLSRFILENTGLDTSDVALKKYADTELLLFQNKTEAALAQLDEMAATYPEHELKDDIHWKKANVLLELGRYDSALAELEKVLSLEKDIRTDDAAFLQAGIYQKYLDDKDKAMQLYRDFLTKYPGSIHIAEARKRFRQMRGDSL